MDNAQPPQGNPVLNAYQNFISSTPLVTRYVLQSLVFIWLFDVLFPMEMALSNVPYFSVQHFEVYRILVSPIVGNSILTLIFIVLIFFRMGKQLEWSHGSTGLICLMATMGWVTNVAFILACYTLYFMGQKYALFLSSNGFWLIIMPLIVIDCMQFPDMPRKLLFFPCNIPSKFFPLALFGLFSIFTGPSLALAIALGIGYLYSLGYLNKLKPATARLESWEAGWLASVVAQQGYVPVSGAIGQDAWLAQNQNAPERPDTAQARSQPSSSSGVASIFNRGTGAANPADSADQAEKGSFKGSARTLGTTGGSSLLSFGRRTERDQSEVQQRRLAALAAAESRYSAHPDAIESAPLLEFSSEDVLTLTDMGYSEEDARRSLAMAGNLEGALALLV